MTVDDFHAVITSKVQGTWNLHRVSLEQKHQPLDFFTLLSSISGVEGKKGQANYAAANVFLDAFATYRQSLGLPAHSVNLGVIEDVGYIAERGGMEAHFDRRHWTYINETVLRRILSYSIFQQTQTQTQAQTTGAEPQLVTGIAVPQPADSNLIRDARFAAMFFPGDDGAAAGYNNDTHDDNHNG
ncbi:hypothetical protein VTN02DRAFT_2481 [Thermoascus thermophilus]